MAKAEPQNRADTKIKATSTIFLESPSGEDCSRPNLEWQNVLKNWSPKSYPEDFPGNKGNQERYVSFNLLKDCYTIEILN